MAHECLMCLSPQNLQALPSLCWHLPQDHPRQLAPGLPDSCRPVAPVDPAAASEEWRWAFRAAPRPGLRGHWVHSGAVAREPPNQGLERSSSRPPCAKITEDLRCKGGLILSSRVSWFSKLQRYSKVLACIWDSGINTLNRMTHDLEDWKHSPGPTLVCCREARRRYAIDWWLWCPIDISTATPKSLEELETWKSWGKRHP